jgi:hypothetical protein
MFSVSIISIDLLGNDMSNQQDAAKFPFFIDPFKFAVHVSGNNFAHF